MTPLIAIPAHTSARLKRRAFLLVVALLILSLIPIWALHYLPLQDYPQNLFQAKLTAQVLSGHPLDSSFYQVHLKPTYSVFFLCVWFFQFLLPLPLAGKAAVSLYFVLTAWAAWRTMGFTSREGVPGWGALLLFPAAFNPIYFLGFFHFLYAMPLLLLALLHLLAAAKEGWTTRRMVAHFFWLLALLWIHPFAIVLYALLAATALLPLFRKTYVPRRIVVGLLIAAVLAVAWILPGLFGRAGSVSPHHIYFQPILKNAAFFLDLFTGLRGPQSPDLPTLILWSAIAALFAWNARRLNVQHRPLLLFALAGIAILIAAILFSPFGTANASYLNVRMSVAVYLLLALIAAMIPLSNANLLALVTLIVLLLANAFAIQLRISRETAEIEPLVAAMQPDAVILPLLFDRDSSEADGYFFSLHLNDPFYYQIEKNGASPYLLEAPNEGRAPLSFRPGAQPPAPDAYFPTDFRWEKYGNPYRYFLVRGGSPSLYRYMDLHASLLVTSGKWRLYEKR